MRHIPEWYPRSGRTFVRRMAEGKVTNLDQVDMDWVSAYRAKLMARLGRDIPGHRGAKKAFSRMERLKGSVLEWDELSFLYMDKREAQAVVRYFAALIEAIGPRLGKKWRFQPQAVTIS